MNNYKQITARFNSKCSKCNKQVKKNEVIYWKKYSPVLCQDCFESDNLVSSEASYIQANEDAYFDNFCHNNNI